jgi:hypothetical protein
MKLFTKAILKKLPTLDETADTSMKDLKVHLKLFNPVGAGYWYIYAYNPDEKLAMGFVNLNDPEMAELGYISITELEEYRGPLGLGIERDISFESMPLPEIMDKVRAGGHV